MVSMVLVMNAEGVAKDIPEDKLIHVTQPFTCAALPGGMESGKTSVAFLIPLPSGTFVLAETSLALLNAAARAFATRYGE